MRSQHTKIERASAGTAMPRSSELAGDLHALLPALRTVTARLEEVLEQRTIEPATWLSTSEAAELAHIGCTQSMRNWARKYNLGIKVHDRWQIDRNLLEAFLHDRAQAEPAQADASGRLKARVAPGAK